MTIRITISKAERAHGFTMYIEPFPKTDAALPSPASESRANDNVLAYLSCALALGEGFVVVTGENGPERASLVRNALASFPSSGVNVISLESTGAGGEELLRLIAQGVGIETAAFDETRPVRAIEDRLERDCQAGRRTLLVIDEAEALPPSSLEALRLLSDGRFAGKALVQVLLIGSFELSNRLASPDLDPLSRRVIAIHRIETPDAPERVLPLRAGHTAGSGSPDHFALERRIASLEARLLEQESTLRRVLGLLVDWTETRSPKTDGRAR